MITNVRKLGDTGPFRSIETQHDECACCEAARGVAWAGAPGVIFFEVEGGEIRRVQNLGLPESMPLALLCREVTAEEARAELGDWNK